VAQTSRNEHQGGVAIGEGAHHPGSSADLTQDALKRVIGSDPLPVGAGKMVVCQGLINAFFDLLGGLIKLLSF